MSMAVLLVVVVVVMIVVFVVVVGYPVSGNNGWRCTARIHVDCALVLWLLLLLRIYYL